MLSLSVHSPLSLPPKPPAQDGWEEVVRTAREEAISVSGAFAELPFEFRTLDSEAEALLDRSHAGAGEDVWVLVTVRGAGEIAHRAHLHERCLTAAQRFMLSLACDGVESEWVADGLPSAQAFRAAGFDLGHDVPLGLIRCYP